MPRNESPIPPHYDSGQTGRVWRVPYQQRADEARAWAERNDILPASNDGFKICLLLVDVQNTFCIPEFELFVAGRSGTGAVDDNRRLCEFIYRNLGVITRICPTMDTHQAMQIFHSIFFVDRKGGHPPPFTLISVEDVENGVWEVNPEAAKSLNLDPSYAKAFLRHYARTLRQGGKYNLTVWPYHAMLGGIGHALVPAVEEAIFFHSLARYAQADFHIKGDRPLTEHYSVLGPEVLQGPDARPLGQKSDKFLQKLMQFDAVVIAGQAKSHCVAWTIDDLLSDILIQDAKLAEKVYLLEDCTSPVVVPGAIDYTEQADAAFRRFADAGMHIVRSTDPITAWPGIRL